MSCKPAPRFEAVLAPDDRWMIFDLVDGLPAEVDGRILIGLDRRTAFDLERRLNRTVSGQAESRLLPNFK